MFPTLDIKIADRVLTELRDGGAEGRASKLVRKYRRNPTHETRDAARAAINALPKARLAELRQAARI